jgi:hypothetical protein
MVSNGTIILFAGPMGRLPGRWVVHGRSGSLGEDIFILVVSLNAGRPWSSCYMLDGQDIHQFRFQVLLVGQFFISVTFYVPLLLVGLDC